MTDLLTSAQMRATEQAAIESGQVTGLELMERAGQGVIEALFAEWPDLIAAPQKALVLCGPGNNGGDGFVVARLLKEWGWEVSVYLFGDAGRLPPDARVNYERWIDLGSVVALPVVPGQDFRDCDVVFDALFGTGLGRPVEGLDDVFRHITQYADQWEMGQTGPRVVAIDIASGICADSGRELRGQSAYSRSSIDANLTVTFHRAKPGHFCALGYAAHRSLRIVDIGLDGDEGIRLINARDVAIAKHHLDHKFANGHALVLSGGAGRTGAARLAARGALRIGAGLVTLGVPPSAQMEVACQITALMLKRIEDGAELLEVLGDRRITALCLGPGLGVERARDLVTAACKPDAHRAMVLDADALTAFADDPYALFGMLHPACVLTPHGGEFARLFPDLSEKLSAPARTGPAFSKVDATREAARRAGCVVLFKGADTVIATPDGRCSVNAALYERVAPWLATAGSGDVLAGFITGLLARGLAPMRAAEVAAWLHVEAARSFGPGLIAEDLPECLPQVLRALNQ